MQSESFYTHQSSIPYSALSPLNTLDIYLPVPSAFRADRCKYWIIYIHGGAWRDPLITSKSIKPSLSHLSPLDHPIAGIASLNYRLSPYPSHTTLPSSTDDIARNVEHPSHLEDVVAAIAWLQVRYRFSEGYMIAGHSCGATLAFQTVMGLWSNQTDHYGSTPMILLPCAIVGVEGIYDLVELRNTNRNSEYGTLYQAFLEGAFSADDLKWERASPTTGDYSKSWPNGSLTVLAWSKEDKLVDCRQIMAMSRCLEQQKTRDRRDMTIELTGNHDEIWEHGRQLANAIVFALTELQRSVSHVAHK
ncbi:hypothetical protein MMC13_004553 [Lambiella insularis]|nr:hypothetical protein [Lambiella insularis]